MGQLLSHEPPKRMWTMDEARKEVYRRYVGRREMLVVSSDYEVVLEGVKGYGLSWRRVEDLKYVMSYMWGGTQNISGVSIGASTYSNIERLPKDILKSGIWVDCLCHLSVPAMVEIVVSEVMGDLYMPPREVIVPAMLWNPFQRSNIGAMLNRAWIFQEQVLNPVSISVIYRPEYYSALARAKLGVGHAALMNMSKGDEYRMQIESYAGEQFDQSTISADVLSVVEGVMYLGGVKRGEEIAKGARTLLFFLTRELPFLVNRWGFADVFMRAWEHSKIRDVEEGLMNRDDHVKELAFATSTQLCKVLGLPVPTTLKGVRCLCTKLCILSTTKMGSLHLSVTDTNRLGTLNPTSLFDGSCLGAYVSMHAADKRREVAPGTNRYEVKGISTNGRFEVTVRGIYNYHLIGSIDEFVKAMETGADLDLDDGFVRATKR